MAYTSLHALGRRGRPGGKTTGRAAPLGVSRRATKDGSAPAAYVAMGDGGTQREVRRGLASTRRSCARNRRPPTMAISDRAGAYRWWSLEEHGKPLTVDIGRLVAALGPAEVAAIAEGEFILLCAQNSKCLSEKKSER